MIYLSRDHAQGKMLCNFWVLLYCWQLGTKLWCYVSLVFWYNGSGFPLFSTIFFFWVAVSFQFNSKIQLKKKSKLKVIQTYYFREKEQVLLPPIEPQLKPLGEERLSPRIIHNAISGRRNNHQLLELQNPKFGLKHNKFAMKFSFLPTYQIKISRKSAWKSIKFRATAWHNKSGNRISACKFLGKKSSLIRK